MSRVGKLINQVYTPGMNKDNLTFEALSEEENAMVLSAEEKHGKYFLHAKNMVTLMNNMVDSVNKPMRIFFLLFLSQTRNNLTLALLSTIRQHHVQTGMNLRQVLEASAWAAYGMAHEDEGAFFRKSDTGKTITTPDTLKNARDKWLTVNHAVKSKEIKQLKKQINETVAHANVVYTFQNFAIMSDDTPGFATSFADFEDEFQIKTNLLMVANFAMGIMELFGEINNKEKVFEIKAEFPGLFTDLINEHNQLRQEVSGDPRFQALATEDNAISV